MIAGSPRFPELRTGRLLLRRPAARDESAMLAFLQSPRAEFYGGPMTPAQAWTKYAAYAGQWLLRGYGLFVAELGETGETVGMAGPFHPAYFPEPEMSWLVTDAGFEGRGLAHEACAAVLRHLFDDLGWASVVSYIDRANHRSRALAARLGATLDPAAPVPIAGCDGYRHRPQGGTA